MEPQEQQRLGGSVTYLPGRSALVCYCFHCLIRAQILKTGSQAMTTLETLRAIIAWRALFSSAAGFRNRQTLILIQECRTKTLDSSGLHIA